MVIDCIDLSSPSMLTHFPLSYFPTFYSLRWRHRPLCRGHGASACHEQAKAQVAVEKEEMEGGWTFAGDGMEDARVQQAHKLFT